jgi:signal transduction histidine kinase
MFQRPAFIGRFLSRLPDPFSARFQLVGWTGLMSGAFAVLLVLGALQLDQRRCAEVARVRAETLARTAGLWLDGDAHSALGADPEKRLSDLGAVLAKLVAASDFDGTVRTLRPKASEKTALAASPGSVRKDALEVVLQTGENQVRVDVDYEPLLAGVLLEEETVSRVQRGRVQAFAPIPDSWNAVPALVLVEGPASAPLWRRIAFGAAAALLGGLFVAGAVALARKRVDVLEKHFQSLEFGLSELGRGVLPPPFALSRHAPRELQRLCAAAEAVRARVDAQLRGQPMPTVAAAAPGAPSARALSSELGEASEFDLGLIVQQLTEPARKMALTRGLDFRLVFPDGIPTQLIGYPMPLFGALDGLVRNGLRSTDHGQITLRVARAGEGADGWRLRFEVSDTGPGIAFNEQQELVDALAAAAQQPASELSDPLQQAASLARALGGELSFESQPGQGSRFGFTCAFSVPGLRPATAFQPRRAAVRLAS